MSKDANDGGPRSPGAGPNKHPGTGRKKQRRSGGSDRPRSTGVHQHAQEALDLLQRLIRRVASGHPDFLTGLELPKTLALPLELALSGPKNRAADLLQLIQEQLVEGSDLARVVRIGHIYCFQCRQADCKHALPPAIDHVFAGYLPTGKPGWVPFSRACLDHQPADVDKLFGSESLVSIVMQGQELRKALLDDFGKNSRNFRVLAQLCTGFITVDGDKRVLSFQAISSHPRGQPKRVDLNILGLTPADLEGSRFGPFESAALRELLRRTRFKLAQSTSRRSDAQGEPGTIEQRAVAALTQLSGGIERLKRKKARSTQHVRERAKQARPTAAAMADLASARDDQLFRDTRKQTLVVLGPKGRVHIFSHVGRHVTSLKLERDQIQGRLERGRWSKLSRREIDEFRQTFQPEDDALDRS